jgi:hypothetical protein
MGAVLAAPEQFAILTGLLASGILAVVAWSNGWGYNGWVKDEKGGEEDEEK